MSTTGAPTPRSTPLLQRTRLFLAGAFGLLLLLLLGVCIWSYVRPLYVIQHLQSLPAVMHWDSLPAGTWAGSQRRLIAVENGRFTGATQIWWDAVPVPTAPPAISGMGGGGSSFSLHNHVYPAVRWVSAGFDAKGVATTNVAEWAVPLWSPAAASLLGLILLVLPEIVWLFTLRSRLRRSRGQCVRCAYDLRSLRLAGGGCSVVCPECGLSHPRLSDPW